MKIRLRKYGVGLALFFVIIIALTGCIRQNEKLRPGVHYNDPASTAPGNTGTGLDPIPAGMGESKQPSRQIITKTPSAGSKPKGKIAYGYNWDIWSIDLETGEKQRLTTSVGGSSTPQWSPDGKHLAYNADKKIYIANEEGKQPVQLVDMDSHSFSWSPDGKALVFENECRLYETTYPEGTLTELTFTYSEPPVVGTFGSTCDFEPAWSPDGNRILFTRYFYRYNLTNALGSFLYIGSRSTKTLSLALDYSLIEEIPVPTPDPSKARPLPTEPGTIYYISPNGAVWSPDGKRIAFELYGQIFLMDIRPGAKPQPLPGADDLRLKTKPCWSPDGQWIAFIADNQQGQTGLWVESIDGRFLTLYTDRIDAEQNLTWWMPAR